MEENDFPAKDFLSIQWRHPLLRFHLSHFKGANVNPGISFLLSQLGLGKQSNIEIPNSRYVNLQQLVEACDQSNRGEIKSPTLRLSHLFKRMGPRLGYRITNLKKTKRLRRLAKIACVLVVHLDHVAHDTPHMTLLFLTFNVGVLAAQV